MPAMRTGLALGFLGFSAALLACAAPNPPKVPARAPNPVRIAPPREAPTPAPVRGGEFTRVLEREGHSVWVESAASVIGSEHEPPSRAQERALAKARKNAVEAAGGVKVKAGLLAFERGSGSQADLFVQQFNSARTEGMLTNQEVLDEESSFVESGSGQRHWVLIKARVRLPDVCTEPEFHVKLDLSASRLIEGGTMTVFIESTHDASIYLYGFYADEKVILIPNQYRTDSRMSAGETLIFPGEKELKKQVRLEAVLPPGVSESTESLVVIALKGNRKLPIRRGHQAGVFRVYDTTGDGELFREVLGGLDELKSCDFALDQAAYEIISSR
jgi:hypothetical protein